jgi:ABC-2 type transport system ATP-binding protein
MAEDAQYVLSGRDLHKNFAVKGRAPVRALQGISFDIPRGVLAALVGPDGAGKTTLIRLAAGLLSADSGTLSVLGFDTKQAAQDIQDRIGYMPQRFGLYEDLSVQENLDLYADLHGISAAERRQRYPQLMSMTALDRFTERLAGKLSGGMKQKLGLACTLISSPDLLLLDEPTVGVDPLSRRELWDIIRRLVQERGLTVLMSTSYLDEAERCSHVLVMHEGQVLTQGDPAEIARHAEQRVFLAEPPEGDTARALQARLLDDSHTVDAVPEAGRVRFVVEQAGTDMATPLKGAVPEKVSPRFEDGFMTLLKQRASVQQGGTIALAKHIERGGDEIVVDVHDLVRRFGAFTAVDHVSFQVHRGEIFGLLGPNGAGKTTTFRMLCGLLKPSGGSLRVAGADLRRAGAQARQRIGYVAQKFSLYPALSPRENLEFFASAYGLRGAQREARIRWALEQFQLENSADAISSELPGGYKQRLAMGAALLHEPDLLFLDEPTSGADPLARRAFWRRITALADQGVTVIVTTHFMQEAEYCDHIAILDGGKILAQGAPGEIRQKSSTQVGAASMEEAFIDIVREARQARAPEENAA